MQTPSLEVANRRPLKTRSAAWPHQLARLMANAGFSANGVSVFGLVFALAGSGALLASASANGAFRVLYLVVAAIGVQLRLLCNLLDGLIAVENNRRSKVGELFNEVPDRFADVALLLCTGLAAPHPFGPTLGWTAATLALGTAYVRMVGSSLLGSHDFSGPFAKPQRMAVLTLACVGSAIETLVRGTDECLVAGIVLIALGTALTVVRRLARLASALAAR